MSNHQAGHDAEARVAEWLIRRKFKIVELNWKTRQCEIDIVAQAKQVTYFIEVKSRTSAAWGKGLDYVTPKKITQMRFAADMWLAQHDWSGDVRLAVVSVDGKEIEFVEILD